MGIELGEGGDAFGPAVYLSAGEHDGPIPIAAGRFSGGAVPDLVVGDATSDEVALLENHSTPGALNFAPAKLLDPGKEPFAFAVADFNHDGTPDLAVADADEGGSESGFTIMEGTGRRRRTGRCRRPEGPACAGPRPQEPPARAGWAASPGR